MNLYEFMSESPWLSFFLALLIANFVKVLVKTPFRAMNIRKHGWPPSHCDSDGDIKRENNE